MNTPKLLLIISLLLMAACSQSPRQSITEGSAQAADTQSNEQWHCEGDNNKQWRCRDLAAVGNEPTPGKAETRTATAAAAAVTEAPAPKKPLTVAAEEAASTEGIPDQTAVAPGISYADDSYVVQLIAAKEQVTIDRFRQQNPQISPKALDIEKDGERWLVLILGTYTTYSEAKKAVDAITPPLSNPPWIRPIAPILEILQTQR